MADQSLKNKKIIISAGASGIGLATSKVCLSENPECGDALQRTKYVRETNRNDFRAV